jgi:hypothetical protein
MANLSDELMRFIAQEFHSIDHLEILLLLRGERERWWRESDVFDIVRSSLQSVAERLQQLYTTGFLERREPTSYRYAPKTPARAQLVDELADAYRLRRMAVIDAIYRPATPAYELARAFRIKRKNQ